MHSNFYLSSHNFLVVVCPQDIHLVITRTRAFPPLVLFWRNALGPSKLLQALQVSLVQGSFFSDAVLLALLELIHLFTSLHFVDYLWKASAWFYYFMYFYMPFWFFCHNSPWFFGKGQNKIHAHSLILIFLPVPQSLSFLLAWFKFPITIAYTNWNCL